MKPIIQDLVCAAKAYLKLTQGIECCNGDILGLEFGVFESEMLKRAVAVVERES